MYRLNRVIVMVVFALIVSGIMPCTAFAASESLYSIDQSFQKAKKGYLQKNMKSAAEQIQKSASYMKGEAVKASDKGKGALTASAEELEKLADDVKIGAVKSRKRIEETFARAYLALASESRIKSTESWAKKETVKAGELLDSAIKNLEKSFAWSGQKAEKGTKEVMKKTKDMSIKLKEKGTFAEEEVVKRLQEAENEIKKFGKRISLQ